MDSFLLADSAEIIPGGKVTIEGAGITHIHGEAPRFVVEHLAAVARFIVDPADQRTAPYPVAVRLLGPGGMSVAQSPPSLIRPSDHLAQARANPDEEHAVFYIVEMRDMEFVPAAVYRLQLLVDGVPVGERRIATIEATETA